MATLAAQPYDYSLPTNGTAALIIIDMQRDFLEPGGFGEALGNDVTRLQAIVPTLQKLQQAFRDRGWLIIQTVEGHQPDLSDCPPSKRERATAVSKLATPAPWAAFCLGGTGQQHCAGPRPKPDEIVIGKPGKGAFYATPPPGHLQTHGITHLIFTGVTTEVCVQTTMREANDRGYECLLVEDGTDSYFPELKQATLEMVRAQGAIVGWTATADQVLAAIAV
jgi:nicotinamidase-related amidase